MSAATTHDPRFVNTRDGVCWERRAVTDSGLGLYAVEGSCKCPPFKMATLAELAEHGIVGSTDVLPVPVGPVPRTLDVVEDELTAAFAPVAALREALSREEPHDSPLHQAHRLGHDLPEGCRLSEEQVRQLGQPFLDGGAR